MQNPTRCIHAGLVSLCLLLATCEQQLTAWHTGKLVVLVPEIAQGPEAEFERELARLFARRLHSTLEIIPLPPDEVLPALRKHQAHLAAVPLRLEKNPATLQFGPGYQSVRELVVCNDDISPIKNLAELSTLGLATIAGSAQEVALREAKKKLPALHWTTQYGRTVQDLLTEVSDGTLDCAVANELQFADARHYYSNSHGDFPKTPIPRYWNKSEFFSMESNMTARCTACWTATMGTSIGWTKWIVRPSLPELIRCCQIFAACSRKQRN
jgi:ABC-type amino acid transport substrate-binding protein